MSAIHLLDAHPGHHQAKRPRPAWLTALASWWAGVARWLRTAGPVGRAPYAPAPEAAESGCWQEPLETAPAAGAAPVISETGAVRAEPLPGDAAQAWPPPPPESWPYPSSGVPVLVPRRQDDGVFVATPDGCELVPRPRFSRHPPETACDMPAVLVPRYLDARPGGTE